MIESLEPATPAERAAAELLQQQRARAILARERRYMATPQLIGDLPRPYTLAKKFTSYGPACVGPHPRPERAQRDSWLCNDCTDRIRRDLLTLAGCWGFLEDLLQRGPGRASEGSGGNDVDAAAPLDLEIAEIRRALTAWCWSLIEHMLEDRPAMSPPQHTETPALLRWAATWHVPYIASHPAESFPAAMIAELDDMVRRVRARLFPDASRRNKLPARCSRLLQLETDQPEPCGGQLWALLRDDADPRGSSITCETDPSHEIPQSDWLGILKHKTKGRR